MACFIESKSDEIAAVCLQLVIKKLFVFGSVLRDDFRPGESDIDLLVEFGPVEVTNLFYLYLDAREAFHKIFQADVDLAMQDAVKNKIISRETDRTKRLVYGT
jgi:predicted nucleotidyltransferase